MLCPKCGESIEKGFHFCPWCGGGIEKTPEIEKTSVVELVEQVGHLKKYQQALRDIQAKIAFRVREVYRNKEYLEKYSSFEDFGRFELGLERAMLFQYKYVGEDFMDRDGEWLIAKGEEWGIAKLFELRPLAKILSMEELNFIIEKGQRIRPECTLLQLREDVKMLRRCLEPNK